MTYLSDLQIRIGETNESSGFNQAKNKTEEELPDYYSNKLLLVVSEITEAHDELRHGRTMTEAYLKYPPVPASLAVEFAAGADATAHWESVTPGKPEGVPSEMADAVIRLFGIAYEAGIDLEAAIEGKLAYNATREFMHGKKF